MVPSWAAQTAFASELSKAITFCLRSYPGEILISHSNLTNRELSNDALDEVGQRRKVALHTISDLFIRRVVEFRARYRQIQVRGFWEGRQNLETV